VQQACDASHLEDPLQARNATDYTLSWSFLESLVKNLLEFLVEACGTISMKMDAARRRMHLQPFVITDISYGVFSETFPSMPSIPKFSIS